MPFVSTNGATSTPASAVWLDSDHLEITAEIKNPGVLLITDTYSSFWRLSRKFTDIQKTYTILPGNYFQMAIPLTTPGKHHFVIEYMPSLVFWGVLISLIGVALFLMLCIAELRKNRMQHLYTVPLE